MIGKTILHYKILEEIGRGGMGVVYKAEDTKLERTVAIKLLPAHLLASAHDRARFHREAKAAAALNHPNIATVYEINEYEGKPFIVMEYVEGKTLNDALEEELFKLKDAVSIAIQVAEGLKAAHAKNIVHRDIKSGNVLLSTEGQAKILDFGLAKTAMSTKLTKMGSTLGTVAYMSPEQVSTQSVDHRTDLWSLGVVLFEMLSGRFPFSGEYDQAIFYNILNEPPEPLTAIRSGIPMSLEWTVNKLLAKNPDERYQNANDLIIDLKAIDLQASGFSRVSAVTSQSKVIKPPRVKKTIPLSWGIVLLGLLLILTVVYFTTPGKPGLSLSNYKYTPFETEGIVYAGRWSPDGKSIAYVKAVNGVKQVRIRSLSNPRSTLLTTVDGGRDLFWAPDGQSLYSSIYIGDTSYSVILPIGNGETVHLPDSAFTWGLPTWSPNGKWIALKQKKKIRLISPDGKKEKLIIPPVDPSAWQYCMAWSRDSKKIYIGSSVGKVSRLDVIDSETGNSRKIAEYGSDVWFGQGLSQSSTASISRDGKGLIVTATFNSGSLHILDGALR